MASPIDPNLGNSELGHFGARIPLQNSLPFGGIPNRQVLRRLEIPTFTSVEGTGRIFGKPKKRFLFFMFLT